MEDMDIWQNSKWLLTILILPNNHTCNSYVTKTAEKVFFFATVKIATINILRTFAQKFSNNDFFLKILPLKDDELVMSEM